jgi:hypothetical protein
MNLVMVAWVSIGVAIVCALVIGVDEARHPQAMGVMNVVWPVTALYFSVFAVWAYFALGRKRTRAAMHQHPANPMSQKRDPSAGSGQAMGHPGSAGMEMDGDAGAKPTLAQVAVGTSHCGAGCVIADVACEFWIAAAGITLLGSALWAGFAIDFVAAWALGIVFQYWAIKPMREGISVGAAVVAAIKADTLSIVAFQVGMYAWMALMYFKLFRAPHLTAFDPRYWLMMQVAMVCGFATSLPMNRVLIGMGLKEAM